jgi:hypothetical protein
MRNFILFLIIFLPLSTLKAQEDRTFRFGLKASPNLAWMRPDATGLKSGNPSLRFTYGLMSEFFISDNYLFATGIEFMSVGGSIEFDPDVYQLTPPNLFTLQERTYNISYVNIPLTLKMRTNEIGYMRYFGQFGFDAGLRTGAKAEDEGFYSAGNPATLKNVNISGDAQLFRVALNLGLGVEYNIIGNTNLVASLNYNNAFTNALKKRSETLLENISPIQPKTQRAMANFVSLNLGVIF